MLEGLGYVPGVMLENSLSKLSVGSLLAGLLVTSKWAKQWDTWTYKTPPLKLTVRFASEFCWPLVSNKGDSELGDHHDF